MKLIIIIILINLVISCVGQNNKSTKKAKNITEKNENLKDLKNSFVENIFMGFDMLGIEKSCTENNQRIDCLNDSLDVINFVEECKRDNGRAIRCSCNDWICVKPTNDEIKYNYGVGINGSHRRCREPKNVECSNEILARNNVFIANCKENGRKIFLCGCHDYICTDRPLEVKEQKEMITYTVDMKGEEKNCSGNLPDDLLCSNEFTDGDSFAQFCRKNDDIAIPCDCHDYVCKIEVEKDLTLKGRLKVVPQYATSPPIFGLETAKTQQNGNIIKKIILLDLHRNEFVDQFLAKKPVALKGYFTYYFIHKIFVVTEFVEISPN